MTRRFTRFLRRNTIALLALFVALSGTTVAAENALGPNTVGARQLKKNAVTTSKIRANAVTGAKVKHDSLTGADILESSLGKVPSAASADAIATSTRGVAIAGVTSPGQGTNPVAQVWFNRVGGIPIIQHPSTGSYRVTIPGMSINVMTNAIATSNGPRGEIVAVTSGSGSLIVSVINDAGTPVDDYFSVVVYGASASG